MARSTGVTKKQPLGFYNSKKTAIFGCEINLSENL